MRLKLNVGNLAELVAAGLLVWGIDIYTGTGGAVLTAAVVVGILAETSYDGVVVQSPALRRPKWRRVRLADRLRAMLR